MPETQTDEHFGDSPMSRPRESPVLSSLHLRPSSLVGGGMTQPFGWNIDPYGLHEHRYFSGGQPTKLVRDGGRESYDEPPDSPPPVVQPDPVSPVSPMEPQLSPVAVATRPDVGTASVNEAPRVDDRPSPPSRRRRLVPLLAWPLGVGLIVALVVVLIPGSGSPPQRSACSLLTSTEASALLGYRAASSAQPSRKSRSRNEIPAASDHRRARCGNWSTIRNRSNNRTNLFSSPSETHRRDSRVPHFASLRHRCPWTVRRRGGPRCNLCLSPGHPRRRRTRFWR